MNGIKQKYLEPRDGQSWEGTVLEMAFASVLKDGEQNVKVPGQRRENLS